MLRSEVAMIFLMAMLLLAWNPSWAHASEPNEKTLVSWVALDEGEYRGGSVLTLQRGPVFDAIVFSEVAEERWMAGSNGFARTRREQDYAPENRGGGQLIQVAVVYDAGKITLYRNGQPLSSYPAEQTDLITGDGQIVVFGLRHIGGDGSIKGAIEDARIYAQALTAEQLGALKPNQLSDVEPWAWFDFEGDEFMDRTGRFPFSALNSEVHLEGGRLLLNTHGVAIAAGTQEGADSSIMESGFRGNPSEWNAAPPAMPEPIPDTWLTYHLAHPGPDRAIPADPNCAIYYKGKYHLHYIYNEYGCSFAHVTSTDMLHWEWQPSVLAPPITGHGMFSGTAFLTKENVPAIIYHGQGSGRNQIAIAKNDDLSAWTKPVPVEPLTANGEPADMRHWDPDCWLIDDTYYAIGGGSNPTLATSPDLNEWTFQGEFFHPDFPSDMGVDKGEDVSCPNMFKLGDKWMLLCISHGLGARYYLGEFRDGKYLPHHHALMNWARWDFFAPESLLTPDGRRVMWAWCTPWVNDMQRVDRKKNFDRLMNEKLQPGIQSLPRELSLDDDGTLMIKPLRELAQLRTDRHNEENLTIESGELRVLEDIVGDTIELEIVFSQPQATEFGLRVLTDKEGGRGFNIAYGSERDTITLDYIEPPLQLKQAENLTLRIFIDKGMIEVFANDRQAAVAWHDYEPEHQNIALYARGGDVNVERVTGWKMRSVYGDTNGSH